MLLITFKALNGLVTLYISILLTPYLLQDSPMVQQYHSPDWKQRRSCFKGSHPDTDKQRPTKYQSSCISATIQNTFKNTPVQTSIITMYFQVLILLLYILSYLCFIFLVYCSLHQYSILWSVWFYYIAFHLLNMSVLYWMPSYSVKHLVTMVLKCAIEIKFIIIVIIIIDVIKLSNIVSDVLNNHCHNTRIMSSD